RDKKTGQILQTVVAGPNRQTVVVDKVPSATQAAPAHPKRTPGISQQLPLPYGQPAAPPNQSTSFALSDRAKVLFLYLLFYAVLFGVIFVVIRLTKSSSVFVRGHWSTLIENLQASPRQFFANVEKQIERRQVPAMEYSRVDWKEGGL